MEWVTLVFALHAVASAITALTKTPADDAAVAKIYKYIELLAGVVGHAKEKG